MLVAFVIMAFSLTMIYRVSGGVARSSGELGHYQQAALLANSLLDLRDSVPASGWNNQGVSAGYAWSIRSSPFPTDLSGPSIPPLHEVLITISWAEDAARKSYTLRTLRPQARPLPGEKLP